MYLHIFCFIVPYLSLCSLLYLFVLSLLMVVFGQKGNDKPNCFISAFIVKATTTDRPTDWELQDFQVRLPRT